MDVPVLPVAEPPLDREALLLAAVRSASDFALGLPDQEAQRELDGKRFALALRFGCPGEEEAARSWSFDASSRVLRIRIDAEITGKTPLPGSLRPSEIESVEGFWVRRPWMLEPACPAVASAASTSSEEDRQSTTAGESSVQASTASSASEPRVGIAQFFTGEDSRIQRRNERAYEATVQLPEGKMPSTTGYDLVLSGRLSPLPDGRVIACTGGGLAAPSCMISAEIDHVAVKSPAGETIADWSRS